MNLPEYSLIYTFLLYSSMLPQIAVLQSSSYLFSSCMNGRLLIFSFNRKLYWKSSPSSWVKYNMLALFFNVTLITSWKQRTHRIIELERASTTIESNPQKLLLCTASHLSLDWHKSTDHFVPTHKASSSTYCRTGEQWTFYQLQLTATAVWYEGWYG